MAIIQRENMYVFIYVFSAIISVVRYNKKLLSIQIYCIEGGGGSMVRIAEHKMTELQIRIRPDPDQISGRIWMTKINVFTTLPL